MIAKPESPSRARPGRPRSETVRQAILGATLELLEESGLAGLTMEAIAARAGVGKATLYRWWPTRGLVALDAMMREIESAAGVATSGRFRETMIANVRALIVLYTTTARGHAIAAIIGEMQRDPELAEAFRERLMAKRRAALRKLIEAASLRGELRSDVDPELVIDLIYSPIYLRLLLRHLPLDEQFAEQVVDAALTGLARR